ncbi:MAG: aldo/keto reductase, partial [Caldilineaceae bacterium]|nr:aldo/keto reductase [Caldilineaceae bacterium]
MKTVQFGNTDATISEMCLGTMMFGDRCDQAESDRILSAAMDNGVTFVDTAASYCGGVTEEILGNIMQGKRDQLFVGTKVTKTTAADWVLASIDESLARMQTDYVDLYMIHWPREQ